jgi:methionine-rich copper-binding protein CopC
MNFFGGQSRPPSNYSTSYLVHSQRALSMKMVSGAVLLFAAEQSYAHAKLVQFPNEEAASSVLMPASVVFLALGVLLLAWGLVTESRQCKTVA